MMEIQIMSAWLQARLHSVRYERDRGSDIVTYAIMVGLLAAATLAVVAVLVAKAKGHAERVPE